MDNKKKIMIAIIIIVITVLAVTLFALESNNKKKKEEIPENVVNEIQENTIIENEIDENVLNNTANNNTTIEEPNNATTEQPTTSTSEPNTVYQSDKVYNSNSEVGTTNKKEEAINLVKQEWGEDSTVTFSCDSVTTNGEYIIAVTSLETATVKSYFRVNLENKTVTVEF